MSKKTPQRNLSMVQRAIDDVYNMYEFDHKTGRVGINIPLSRKENRALKKAVRKQKKII